MGVSYWRRSKLKPRTVKSVAKLRREVDGLKKRVRTEQRLRIGLERRTRNQIRFLQERVIFATLTPEQREKQITRQLVEDFTVIMTGPRAKTPSNKLDTGNPVQKSP